MGAWGTGILQNDTTADIWVEFKTLYHLGKDVKEIRQYLEKEYSPNNDGDIFADVWTGIAHGQWMCGGIEKYSLDKINEILENDKGLDLWKENERHLKERKKVISTFFEKIKTPREKTLKRKKIVARPAYFKKGDVLKISLDTDLFLYSIVFNSDDDKINGSNSFVFSEASNRNLTLKDVLKSEVLYLDLGGSNNYCRGYFWGIFSARNMSRKIKKVEKIGTVDFDDVLSLSAGIGFPDWNELKDFVIEQKEYLMSNKTNKPFPIYLKDFIKGANDAMEGKLSSHNRRLTKEWLEKNNGA